MSRTAIYDALKRRDLIARKAGRRTLIAFADLEACPLTFARWRPRRQLPAFGARGQGARVMSNIYPYAPGHRGVDTSVAAANDLMPKLGRLQRMVFAAIHDAG